MTAVEESPALTPLDSLKAWAARDPQRTALSDAETSVTFADLVSLVDATAAAGRQALTDAPPGAYLPVLVDRSVGSAVAVLACLLGRVRFFPVDAAASAVLKEQLMRRAGDPGRFLVGAGSTDGIPGAAAIEVATQPRSGTQDLAPPPDLDEPAMVIFSSGSTGEPKGIVLSWDAFERRWRSRDTLSEALGDERSEPLIMPLDSAWGINLIADVASGFTERIVDVRRMRPVQFLGDMATFAPSAMAIPSQLGRLLAQLPARSVVPLPSVRRVTVGSEGFRYEYVRGLQGIFGPNTSFSHSLSSSEGGREIAHAFLLKDAPAEGQLPLGRIVFPENLHLVRTEEMPDGIAEVHVGGAIASGYLDDPDLTEARFYTDDDGRRWWRSGDLVSLDTDGMYVHQGRLDDAVKVGGKLASPSEVTSVLVAIDGITAAITVPVVVEGNTRLVAHVELAPDVTLTRAAVRAILAEQLPAHVVPSAVMRHARLPINVRGKVDRSHLMDGPFEPW